MAKAWRKNNQTARRAVALQNLRGAKFTEKTQRNGHVRTPEEWKARVESEIETLEKRV